MNNKLAQEAFKELFPTKQIPQLIVKFSAKFNDYNGNVKIIKKFHIIQQLEFSLSKKFTESEEDIQKGILQHLLNKVYKTNKESIEQELYHKFIKNLTRYAKRKKSDPYLTRLFYELNEEYFSGLLEKPNMVFGQDSTTTLGHYQYSTDTVSISTILKENEDLLKYVLYHELLHKKHSFTTKNGRASYHTRAFREDERQYKTVDVEKKLERFVRKKRIIKLF